jgi:ribosomal protein S6
MSSKPNKYEALFLMGAQHTSDLEGSLKLVRSTIEKHGGTILVAKKWDERKLVYEIGKLKRGLYIIAYFEAVGSAVTPLERDVRLSEEFTRVLITTAGHLDLAEMEAVEPQPIAPPPPERQPWDVPAGVGMGGYDRPSRRNRDEEVAEVPDKD